MEGGVALHNDTPAVTAISPIRATTRHIFFAAKAHTAIATFAAAYKNFCLVNEHRTLPHMREGKPAGKVSRRDWKAAEEIARSSKS
jgi:hypothetical protein